MGENGAGPHDLRRMASIGRVYWDAAPSQFYAEPKRLAKLGYLDSRKEPGKTRERTHYSLTDKGRAALADWSRTPADLPRIQNEPAVRLMAASLVDPAAVAEGLRQMRAAIDEARAGVARSDEGADALPAARRRLVELNNAYAARYLELQAEWLEAAERALGES